MMIHADRARGRDARRRGSLSRRWSPPSSPRRTSSAPGSSSTTRPRPSCWSASTRRARDGPSITWPQSVDQALCFGWIDGVRRRIDDASYSIRFTPRKARSTWSAINVKRVAELTRAGPHAPGRHRGLRAPQRGQDRDLLLRAAQGRRARRPSEERRFRPTRGAWAWFRPSRRPTGGPRPTGSSAPRRRRPGAAAGAADRRLRRRAPDPVAHPATRVRRRASVNAAPARGHHAGEEARRARRTPTRRSIRPRRCPARCRRRSPSP